MCCLMRCLEWRRQRWPPGMQSLCCGCCMFFLFVFLTILGDFKGLVAGFERVLHRVSTPSPHLLRICSVASVFFRPSCTNPFWRLHVSVSPKRNFLRNPAGWLGLLVPCSRAPQWWFSFFFFLKERERRLLSAWTPAGLKFPWWAFLQVSYLPDFVCFFL